MIQLTDTELKQERCPSPKDYLTFLCHFRFVAGAGRGNRGGGGSWERTEVALSLHGPGSGSSTTPLSDALERVVRLQV